MSFEAYRERIQKACAAASHDRLDAFCADVFRRMLPYVAAVGHTESDERAVRIVGALLVNIRSGANDWDFIARALSEIDDVISDLRDTGGYLAGEVADFLDALNYWSEVHRNGTPSAAAKVSECMMNILDHHFVESSVQLSDWASVGKIKEELQMQLAFLR